MQKLLVAIVEDDEDDREFISSSMQKENDVEIIVFSSGTSFLEYIKTANTLPSLVVTDLKMPVVSGFDVIQAIKSDSKSKDITVIVLSTSGNENDIKKAKELGAAGYYVKPYSFAEYSTITDKIIQVLRTGFYPFHKMKEEFLNTFYALLPIKFFTKGGE
jgi:CheY-like chemotaxis protein